jgi:general secretion pathway protein E
LEKQLKNIKREDLPKVPLIMEGLSLRFIRENMIVPIELKGNLLTIATVAPADKSAVDAVRVATSKDVEVCVTDGEAINEYISKFYGQEQNIDRIIEEINDRGFDAEDAEEEDLGYLKDLASEAPIIKIVNMLIIGAVENRASDIHIEPFEDEMKVRYRVDGVLYDVESIPKRLQPAIVSRIKLTAKLNIAERRLPQDGRIMLKVGERELDLRVSTIPVLYGESLVLRILDRKGIKVDLEGLGFPPLTFTAFKSLIKKPNGIILVTGPTGSGKTTTLYGSLDKLNSPEKKIITVEDPVEYHLKGVNQIQVKPNIDLNFANILRHIVRQDPDIIMIGEIRDLETAEIAIQSSLTGHLVFSTLHTNDAPSALTRLLDMGVENFLLASTVRGILAQRLVRVICPSCKVEVPIREAEKEAGVLGLKSDSQTFNGRGCEKCAHTGYFGRTGIFELLLVDDEIERLLIQGADSKQIREYGRSRGMVTLLEDGGKKVSAGITTLSELLRVTQE